MKILYQIIEEIFIKKGIDFKIETKDVLTILIPPNKIYEGIKLLRENENLLFDYLLDITACDYPDKNEFEVIYHLYSFLRNERIRIKSELERKKPEILSITSIFPSANWFEREIYDLFGIKFINHPNLKRILLWDNFPGHPLRKDYPLERKGPVPKLEDIY